MTNDRLARTISLALFVFGLLGSGVVFTDVQVMNGVYHLGSFTISFRGYPWWTERLTEQSCLVGSEANCGFLNYGQALLILLSVSFSGFFCWLYLSGEAGIYGRFLRALGVSLLFFGLLLASVIFLEVQVFNGIYQVGPSIVSFEGFPYGGQEVLGSACFVGSDQYHCALLNYDEVLMASLVAAFLGFVMWQYPRPGPSSTRA